MHVSRLLSRPTRMCVPHTRSFNQLCYAMLCYAMLARQNPGQVRCSPAPGQVPARRRVRCQPGAGSGASARACLTSSACAAAAGTSEAAPRCGPPPPPKASRRPALPTASHAPRLRRHTAPLDYRDRRPRSAPPRPPRPPRPPPCCGPRAPRRGNTPRKHD